MENADEYLVHYGVLGMKWGVRKEYDPKAEVRKSHNTKTFERLANSGEKHAAKQKALYKKTGNPYNLSSANQWTRESKENRENARLSYERDVFNKTANRKQKRNYKARSKEYAKRRNDLRYDVTFLSDVQTKGNKIIDKWNKRLAKEGLTGPNHAQIMKDAKKRAQYEEYAYQCKVELGKVYTDEVVKRIGAAPAYV